MALRVVRELADSLAGADDAVALDGAGDFDFVGAFGAEGAGDFAAGVAEALDVAGAGDFPADLTGADPAEGFRAAVFFFTGGVLLLEAVCLLVAPVALVFFVEVVFLAIKIK